MQHLCVDLLLHFLKWSNNIDVKYIRKYIAAAEATGLSGQTTSHLIHKFGKYKLLYNLIAYTLDIFFAHACAMVMSQSVYLTHQRPPGVVVAVGAAKQESWRSHPNENVSIGHVDLQIVVVWMGLAKLITADDDWYWRHFNGYWLLQSASKPITLAVANKTSISGSNIWNQSYKCKRRFSCMQNAHVWWRW